ncbi:fimbrial chaperone [Escherichia coli]|uniref:fimbrial chaperone n=1 Tax=Escherichia coli TaxID=562 RepID=UPI0005AAD5BD|nr:fimbrial chaperone [Escherichia coli]
MNSVKKSLFFLFVSIIMQQDVFAAFTLNGTRFIYPEGNKSISFEVTNNADKNYGGQVWIDNLSSKDDDVFMIAQPPFFKVNSKQKQVLRIIKVSDNVPNDRESLFWLNVQEIPPKPLETDGNILALAMNTKVKIFYRPESIAGNRKDAEKNIIIKNIDNKAIIRNPTPYYFAIVDIKLNNEEIRLNENVKKSLSIFEPYSSVSLDRKLSGKVTIRAINDWGGVQSYDIK